MPSPTGRDLYVDVPVTTALAQYQNPAFIANGLGTPVPVSQQTGIYPKILQSQFFRDLATPRKGGGKATESGFGTDMTTTYYLPRYSHAVRVLDDDRRYAGMGPFDLDVLASKLAYNTIDLKREITLATSFFAASKGWNDKAAGTDFTAWDDAAASNPMLDVAKFVDEIEGKIGAEPNVLVLGKVPFTNGLRWNPALLDLVRFTQKPLLSVEDVQTMLGVRLVIGRAIYTTTAEGVAEASVSYSRVWGKSGLLLNQPESGMMTAPALARLIYSAVPGSERYTRRFRYDEEEFDKFEANTYFAYKQIDARAGTFLGSLVS